MRETITIIDPGKDSRWDTFVQNHSAGWICHLSGWKTVLEKTFKHMRGHYLALINNGEIQSALPIFEVRSWLTGNRLVSIPYATLCDPLVSSCEDMDKLLDAALNLAKDLGIDSLEIRTMHSACYVRDNRLGQSPFYKHHYLVLDRPPEELSKKFHRTCVRQRITRALKSDIYTYEGETEFDLQEFYNLNLMSRKRLGLPPQPYNFFRTLWETFHPTKRITLLMARKENQVIGSLMLFKFKDRVSAEFAVYDNNFMNISPQHRMFWEAIQSAQREGYRIFDFGRTSPNNQTLMDFKNRWGTSVIDLSHFYYPRELSCKDAEKDNSTSRKVIREVCKTAPKPLFVGLGKFLYRHMG